MITTTFLDSVNVALAMDGVKAVATTRTSNNGVVREGVSLEGVTVSPVVYVDDNMTPEQVADVLKLHIDEGRRFEGFMDDLSHDNILSHVFPQLVAWNEDNKEFLQGKVYTPFKKDLVVLFRYVVSLDSDGLQSIVIPSEWLEAYNLTVADLYDASIEYVNSNYTLKGMAEMMAELLGCDEDDIRAMSGDVNLLILSNQHAVYGASAIISHDILNDVHDKLGDFFIIPSSVHEVLLLPVNDGGEAEAMADMIKAVNTEHVAPNEVLGNHAYRYDGYQVVDA